MRRTNAHDFLSICRAEYDRLIEQSPTIDDDIINTFRKKFKSYDVSKPAITNGLDKCIIYTRKEDRDKDLEVMKQETDEEMSISSSHRIYG